VRLVPRLPHVEEKEADEYEKVLTTFNQGDIAVIKSILEDAGIAYFLRGEIFNLVDPLIQPAILLVRKDQVAKARSLLSHMNVTFLGVSRGRSERDDEKR
jgi:hypothetical protein